MAKGFHVKAKAPTTEKQEWDYEAIKEFKNAFYDNIIHPALFGKSKLKNEKYVSCSLEQLILQISAKVQEFKDFLEN